MRDFRLYLKNESKPDLKLSLAETASYLEALDLLSKKTCELTSLDEPIINFQTHKEGSDDFILTIFQNSDDLMKNVNLYFEGLKEFVGNLTWIGGYLASIWHTVFAVFKKCGAQPIYKFKDGKHLFVSSKNPSVYIEVNSKIVSLCMNKDLKKIIKSLLQYLNTEEDRIMKIILGNEEILITSKEYENFDFDVTVEYKELTSANMPLQLVAASFYDAVPWKFKIIHPLNSKNNPTKPKVSDQDDSQKILDELGSKYFSCFIEDEEFLSGVKSKALKFKSGDTFSCNMTVSIPDTKGFPKKIIIKSINNEETKQMKLKLMEMN